MENEYEFYYPCIYDENDTESLKEFQTKLDLISNKGDLNISDLVRGKLKGNPGVMERITEVTLDKMFELAKSYVGDNPLFTDREYAKKTKYGDIIAFPFVAEPAYFPAMPDGFGDFMVVSGLNGTMNYYRPVYEGDRLFTVLVEQHFEDITPAEGSHYRTFAVSGMGKVYNQREELVAEGAGICKESFRRHKDTAKRNAGGLAAWESPDWWHQRERYIYTDEDWETIIKLWKNEKIRGDKILYWDDVKIGDEPVPTVAGPALAETEMDIMFTIPQWATDTKKHVLDQDTYSKMVKNRQGIYVLPEYLEKKTGPPDLPFEMPDRPPELANRDGRAVIQNAVAMKWAACMLYNWMGDEGWLQRIGWDIMSTPPGYDEAVIPHHSRRPDLFDKFPYLEKVPYLKGKRADCHGLEGDVSINKAYVFDKYENKGEYFVDLIWWCETIDKYLIEEGFATVKLPKKI